MEKEYKYICEVCDDKTNNKKDYTKHTLTRKHKRKVNALKLKPPSITPLQKKNKEKKEMEQQEIK